MVWMLIYTFRMTHQKTVDSYADNNKRKQTANRDSKSETNFPKR